MHNDLPSSPSVSVVLLIHGEPLRIADTLHTIRCQSYDQDKIRILCLDDGTSPKARAYLAQISADNLELHDLPAGASISYAKNFGMERSRDDLVFFVDDHIVLERDAIENAVQVFHVHPDIAGVCGYYKSRTVNDWNLLRDIKRESIYGKNTAQRLITRESFTTFSTGIGIVKRAVFQNIGFPEDDFPTNFGGEDVPAVLVALNRGMTFAFSPNIRGIHEHNLSLSQLVQKMEIEVRGRFSLLFWASNHPEIEIPYLHGFLNFPYFFTATLLICLPLTIINPLLILIPACALIYELVLSLKCLQTPLPNPIRYKLAAAAYVFTSDLLSILYAIQYLFSSHKRPYKSLGMRRFLRINKIFLKWELCKYHIHLGTLKG